MKCYTPCGNGFYLQLPNFEKTDTPEGIPLTISEDCLEDALKLCTEFDSIQRKRKHYREMKYYQPTDLADDLRLQAQWNASTLEYNANLAKKADILHRIVNDMLTCGAILVNEDGEELFVINYHGYRVAKKIDTLKKKIFLTEKERTVFIDNPNFLFQANNTLYNVKTCVDVDAKKVEALDFLPTYIEKVFDYEKYDAEQKDIRHVHLLPENFDEMLVKYNKLEVEKSVIRARISLYEKKLTAFVEACLKEAGYQKDSDVKLNYCL